MADTELVDRIMPLIIKRIDSNTLAQKIDGKTLAQKIDAATLLQKIDAKTLAAKVLPYLDLKVSTIERDGQTYNVKGSGNKIIQLKAQCAPDETVVSGGYITYTGDGTVSSFKKIIKPEAWYVSVIASDGQFLSFATCLKVGLGLKEEQQPEQLPPGGPPLQPPSP